MSDPATLEYFIRDLRIKTSTAAQKALVVIDAGIATEENLAKILSAGYDYLCVSRSRLKDYEIVAGSQPVTVEDNRRRKIQLQKVMRSPSKAKTKGKEHEQPENQHEEQPRDQTYYLKVESQAKQKKEVSMNARFRDGYLKGLEAVSVSLSKKSGVKQEHRVHQRVGRLMQKYPSIHKYYQIDYQVEEKFTKKGKPSKRIVTSMSWKLKPDTDMDAHSGIYFLRTSINNENRIIWDSYNAIRDLEYAIRVLKTDLDMRPIFHKKDNSTMAHLNLAILAYSVVNTIRHQLKKEGIKYQWNEIIRIMNTQKAVTTTAQNNCQQIIQIRRCSEPNDKVKQIYQALNYKSTPFKKKKSVVPKSELKKNETPCLRTFRSD
jgi:hypothetical protein